MSAQVNLIGLKVIDSERPYCCGTNVCIIGVGKGPHVGELRCAGCNRHRGWLPKEVFCWLESVTAIYGAPTTPIEMAKDYGAIAQGLVVTAQERARRTHEIRRRIELGGFELKDFFLTPQPWTDWWREQKRRQIAQLMSRYGLSVLDLNELPTDAAPVSGMKASAPESEDKPMDMSEFAGSRFLKVADLEKQGSFKARIVAVERGKFDKANLHLSEGSILSLNVTNCQTLIRSFGAESDDWLDKEIELYLGEVEFEGEMKPTVLVRVISAEVENKKVVKPSKKKSGGDMDDTIPF